MSTPMSRENNVDTGQIEQRNEEIGDHNVHKEKELEEMVENR